MPKSKLLRLGLVLTITGIIIGILAKNPQIVYLNYQTSILIQQGQTHTIIQLNCLVSQISYYLPLIGIALAFYLARQNKKHLALTLIIATLTLVIPSLLKQLFQVPCPNPNEIRKLFYAVLPRTYCYPSSHVFGYTVFFGTIYSLRKAIWAKYPGLQDVMGIFSVGLIALVGISRISLGAHWLTDVIGGYLFGFATFFGIFYFYNRKK